MLNILIDKNTFTNISSFYKYSDELNIIKYDNDLPLFEIINNKILLNIDAILILDGNINNNFITLSKLYNIPLIGIPRYNKSFQSLFLINNNINIPPTFCINLESQNDFIVVLKDYKDDDLFVIKIEQGAKGLGQALLTKTELIYLFELSNEELDYVFKEIESVKVCDYELRNNEDYIKENTYDKNKMIDNKAIKKISNIKWNIHNNLLLSLKYRDNFIIQKYIPNRLEYRMLWFYDNEPIIIKRDMDENVWQANACNNSDDSSKYLDRYDMVPFFNDLEQINSVFNLLNTPFLSVDIYFDIDKNEWGIFEFQTEFGWTNTKDIPYTLMQQRIHDSTLKLIKHIKK